MSERLVKTVMSPYYQSHVTTCRVAPVGPTNFLAAEIDQSFT